MLHRRLYKINEAVGVGFNIRNSINRTELKHNEAIQIGEHNTVLQAEMTAIEKAATFMLNHKIEGRKS